MPLPSLTLRPIPHAPPSSKIRKPLYPIGSYVCAAWWPSPQRKSKPKFYHGVVKNYTFKKDRDYGYGPLVLYDVLFDDDAVSCGIEDCYVYLKEDFEKLDKKWRGVKDVYDRESKDRWAKEIGWFRVKVDGVSREFPRLMEAIREYDRLVVQSKGHETAAADLNLPSDWDWL
jgi:hypothetical protein